MRQDEREQWRQRFAYRCGYCGISESDAGAELTVDHFQPRSQGGAHAPNNWVYSCHACNEYKGDYPLHDRMADHVAELADGTLQSLSETGAFHINRLRLNRQQLVTYRRERRRLEAALAIHARLLERLRRLEGQMQTLTSELELLETGRDGA